jgi:predicted DNA-binding protein
MTSMKGSRVSASIYLDPPTYEGLKKLSESTRIPVAAYLREAVDDLLVKHKVRVVRPKAQRSKP